MDSKLVFSDDQAVTTTADSTNIIDLGVANPNVGEGTPLICHIKVGTACTATGSATVTFTLAHGATSGAATTVLVATAAIPKASLIKGYELAFAIPFKCMRFLKGIYTVATGPLTAGKFDMWIEPKV